MDIKHVVVLMLENRSFDCMLGKLYPSDGTFEGLTGQETNDYAGRPVPVWAAKSINPDIATIPDPDPGELFTDMTKQLFADGAVTAPPAMSGFAANYMTLPKADKPFLPNSVMHYFTPEQVPVISTLARSFAVCDQWYASAPCQTWPNRFFAHTGTAQGSVNNGNFPIPFPAPSIFGLLSAHNVSWRVYFHDVPQSLLLRDVWLRAPLHYRFFDQFLVDASSIEPRYFTDAFLRNIPNDEHPPHNVLFGEQLIARVYTALRQSPSWKNTLFILTFDEHGGCYDHMPPPAAVPPDNFRQDGFAFDRYGVRVPAVIVSPYIPAGLKLRAAPQGLPQIGPPYPFDHTSILATVRKLFGLGSPLLARDAIAPDVLSALSLTIPCNDGPESLSATPPPVSTANVVARARVAPNHMQDGLDRMARSLPAAAPAAVPPPPAAMAPSLIQNVATAQASATLRVKDFLRL